MRVLIAGSGAVGGFYGALLANAGAEVVVLCRNDYADVQNRGMVIHSSTLGTWQFRPHQVVREAAAVNGALDYVIVTTKVLPNLDRVALIRAAVRADTTVVLIQNGVEIEAPIATAFPRHPLISGLAFVCVSRTAPGEIHHQAYGHLVLGNYPRGLSRGVTALCAAFERAGIAAHATPDIIAARWQKCLWNAVFNPVSVLAGGTDTRTILTTQEPLVRAVMQEVAAIAAATGHPVPADSIEKNIANTHAMPPYKTSMLLDFEAGRPMEVEAILGNAVRAAIREGVTAPRLETLYALLQLQQPAERNGAVD